MMNQKPLWITVAVIVGLVLMPIVLNFVGTRAGGTKGAGGGAMSYSIEGARVLIHSDPFMNQNQYRYTFVIHNSPVGEYRFTHEMIDGPHVTGNVGLHPVPDSNHRIIITNYGKELTVKWDGKEIPDRAP